MYEILINSTKDDIPYYYEYLKILVSKKIEFSP